MFSNNLLPTGIKCYENVLCYLGSTLQGLYILEKIYFSRTSRSISINLGTNHPWVKGIFNCSNKGPCPLQRGDNHKNGNFFP
jgi:hypothetical protein